MWRKYQKDNNKDYGYVRLISDNYTIHQDNAEVILIDHFQNGETLVTRWIIRFTEFFGSGGVEEEFEELKKDYISNYGKEPLDIIDVAFYCADGWSRWNAIERIENPTEEELNSFLKKHSVKK